MRQRIMRNLLDRRDQKRDLCTHQWHHGHKPTALQCPECTEKKYFMGMYIGGPGYKDPESVYVDLAKVKRERKYEHVFTTRMSSLSWTGLPTIPKDLALRAKMRAMHLQRDCIQLAVERSRVHGAHPH